MIPRFKPHLGIAEFLSAFSLPNKNDVEDFEKAFAKLMDQNYALAFPYGRTGLILLLEALGLKNSEIICPAYTCVVVPHAITYSGNKPVFIDCANGEFNMDLDLAENAINENTGAIIATSIFGYPVDLDHLDKIRKKYPHIFIIQDCAHSFAAEWKGRPVQKDGVAALFGLNISKILTSIFGGMITTDDKRLYQSLKTLRDNILRPADWKKGLRRLLYLIAVYPSFWEPVYGFVNRLERSMMIDYFVRYYNVNEIEMPKDFLQQIGPVEARTGYKNIGRYRNVVKLRRLAAQYYFNNLPSRPDFKLPPQNHEATYSHFVVQVHDKNKWLQKGIRKGVQLGWLIEYSIPEMKAYGAHIAEEFPVAAHYARTTINLPVWGGSEEAMNVARKILEIL